MANTLIIAFAFAFNISKIFNYFRAMQVMVVIMSVFPRNPTASEKQIDK